MCDVSIDVDYVAGVTSLWTLPAGRLCDDANLHRDYLGQGLGDVTVDTKLHGGRMRIYVTSPCMDTRRLPAGECVTTIRGSVRLGEL